MSPDARTTERRAAKYTAETSAPPAKPEKTPEPTRLRRVGHRIRRLGTWAAVVVLALFAFGVSVSTLGVLLLPEVKVPVAHDSAVVVREITGLYPVTVGRVLEPTSVEQIAAAVRATNGPISIGGGRYSMGGQTAVPGGLQIDMRAYHGVISLDTAQRTVVVRAGTSWRELQRAIDPHGLSVKIMQTYDNFTVGGALGVNAHGRYMGQGPLVRSVRGFTLVLADGSIVHASRTENPDLFWAAAGGYGAIGVVADVELDLAENVRVKRSSTVMPVADYLGWFGANARADSTVLFHNADMYPPAYETLRATSYAVTRDPLTETDRLQSPDQNSAFRQDVYALMASSDFGKGVRRWVIDPVIFHGDHVSWRNWEASYDVSELEPRSRARDTYVLQEYFLPVDSLPVFVPRMGKVFRKHDVNVVNVSIRHALPDTGSFLSWAPTESFAYVVYYRQRTDPASQREVARWTREMLDTVLASGGRWYLPYQPHATRAQFARGYPRAAELFAVKRRVDPTNKFTNVLWDMYAPDAQGNAPAVDATRMPAVLQGEARQQLDARSHYYRNESAEYLTHAEWDLVYTSEAYARWLASGRRPSAFPYVRSVGDFWRSYDAGWHAAAVRSDVPIGTHVMLGVIGLSTAVEYGIKSLYENTLGRAAEWTAPQGGVAEERYAAKVAADYAALITEKGWYEFRFAHALKGLWTQVPLTGPGMIRKWERRLALSGEYGIKAMYASLIGLGTSSAYEPDQLTREMVVAGWTDSVAHDPALRKVSRVGTLDRGYALLQVPRYSPYRDALLALSAHQASVRVAEIGGNGIVTLTGLAPATWTAPARSSVLTAYPALDDGAR
ncbi:MAG TPA: FAD-binding oxidoreductase, partial [Gemmatimonadaceae bacterium]